MLLRRGWMESEKLNQILWLETFQNVTEKFLKVKMRVWILPSLREHSLYSNSLPLAEVTQSKIALKLKWYFSERKKQPIDVEDFPEHVVQLHADSDYLFSEEYLVGLSFNSINSCI